MIILTSTLYKNPLILGERVFEVSRGYGLESAKRAQGDCHRPGTAEDKAEHR